MITMYTRRTQLYYDRFQIIIIFRLGKINILFLYYSILFYVCYVLYYYKYIVSTHISKIL